jgi:DNA integrity scanning protein DisA with diadenylate cyclase activity
MNRLLAGTVRFLNGLLAIILVIAGAVVGSVYSHALGFVLGGISGLVLAAIICGFLALVIEIRSELVRIREALERINTRPGEMPTG